MGIINLVLIALGRPGDDVEVIAFEYRNNPGHIRWLIGGQCAQLGKEPFKILAGADDKKRAGICFAYIRKGVRNEPWEIKHRAGLRSVIPAIQKDLKLTLYDMNYFIFVLMDVWGHATAGRNRCREDIK